MRRLTTPLMIALVTTALALPSPASAATDCIIDSKGQKRCRQVPDDTGSRVGVFVGGGLLLGVAITLLWATRPARSRRGADVRRSELAPEPDKSVDAWASEEGGGLIFGWTW